MLRFLLLSGKSSIYSSPYSTNSTANHSVFHFLNSSLSNRPKFSQQYLGILQSFLFSPRSFSDYAVEQFSDDEYECDFETNTVFFSSSFDDFDQYILATSSFTCELRTGKSNLGHF